MIETLIFMSLLCLGRMGIYVLSIVFDYCYTFYPWYLLLFFISFILGVAMIDKEEKSELKTVCILLGFAEIEFHENDCMSFLKNKSKCVMTIKQFVAKYVPSWDINNSAHKRHLSSRQIENCSRLANQ